jgi:hypothetical protein
MIPLRGALISLLTVSTALGTSDARAQDGMPAPSTMPVAATDGPLGDGGASDAASPTTLPSAVSVDAGPQRITVPPAAPTERPATGIAQRIRELVADPTLAGALRAIIALFLFLAGWLVARLISRGVLSLSRRLLADRRVVETLGLGELATARPAGQEEGAPAHRIDEIVAQAVYYLLLLLVAIVVLEVAGVAESSDRLRSLIDAIVHGLPLVARALVTLVIAFVIGRILQKGTVRLLESLQIDRRFAAPAPPEPQAVPGSPAPVQPRISERVGRIVFWLIMTFGLVSALEALQIGQLSGPLRRALERLTDLLPSLGAGALLMVGGYLLGRIARAVIRNLLEAAGFDRLVARLQLDKPFQKSTPSQAMGGLAMLFVLLQAGIAALNQLELRTVANPLTAMMARLYAALPGLGLAILIMAVGILAARLVRGWMAAVLKNVGLDRMMERIGLGRLRGSGDGLALPSDALALAGQVAVVLIATTQALEALGLTTWAGYVDAVLTFAVERLAVAMVIVVLGFALGAYVRNVIRARRPVDAAEGATWIAGAARYAVLVFAFTIAIHQLGVAEHFVRTAFLLLFGSLCLAFALALGLGGREVAGELVRTQVARTRAALRGEDPGEKR